MRNSNYTAKSLCFILLGYASDQKAADHTKEENKVRSIIEDYGLTIVAVTAVIILVAMCTPIGAMVKSALDAALQQLFSQAGLTGGIPAV